MVNAGPNLPFFQITLNPLIDPRHRVWSIRSSILGISGYVGCWGVLSIDDRAAGSTAPEMRPNTSVQAGTISPILNKTLRTLHLQCARRIVSWRGKSGRRYRKGPEFARRKCRKEAECAVFVQIIEGRIDAHQTRTTFDGLRCTAKPVRQRDRRCPAAQSAPVAAYARVPATARCLVVLSE
jgi:hypothetical protein